MSTAGAPRRVRGFLVMVRDQDSVSALLPYVLIGPDKGGRGIVEYLKLCAIFSINYREVYGRWGEGEEEFTPKKQEEIHGL
ncbi:MAG: hypothetical protein CW742_12340 [Methanoregula sp.]|nr:MAG: hypothetical protein CW742_12340 [Methanoregula sp.]